MTSETEVGGTALDSSVIVPALLAWHEGEHHAGVFQVVKEALVAESKVILPLSALVEAYAVLTRLPAPWRLQAVDAHRLLVSTFLGKAVVVGLDGDLAWDLHPGPPMRIRTARRRTADSKVILPLLPALVEAYAALTRLPATWRLRTVDPIDFSCPSRQGSINQDGHLSGQVPVHQTRPSIEGTIDVALDRYRSTGAILMGRRLDVDTVHRRDRKTRLVRVLR